MSYSKQREFCARYGAPFAESPAEMKVGLARQTLGQMPLHGLRHPPTGDTTGWYIWAGEFSDAPDFFQPVHVICLADDCPEVLEFLGLPPGYRFLTDPERRYVDVWQDAQLLDVA